MAQHHLALAPMLLADAAAGQRRHRAADQFPARLAAIGGQADLRAHPVPGAADIGGGQVIALHRVEEGRELPGDGDDAAIFARLSPAARIEVEDAGGGDPLVRAQIGDLLRPGPGGDGRAQIAEQVGAIGDIDLALLFAADVRAGGVQAESNMRASIATVAGRLATPSRLIIGLAASAQLQTLGQRVIVTAWGPNEAV